MEIPPCVLQDIGPLGPLPKKGGMEGWQEGRNARKEGRWELKERREKERKERMERREEWKVEFGVFDQIT